MLLLLLCRQHSNWFKTKINQIRQIVACFFYRILTNGRKGIILILFLEWIVCFQSNHFCNQIADLCLVLKKAGYLTLQIQKVWKYETHCWRFVKLFSVRDLSPFHWVMFWDTLFFFFPSKYSYRKDLHFWGKLEQFNISIYIWIHIQVSGFISQYWALWCRKCVVCAVQFLGQCFLWGMKLFCCMKWLPRNMT